MPAIRNGPGARSILRDNGCGSCGFFLAFAAGFEINKQVAAFDLHRKSGYPVFFKTGFTEAAATVKLPIVPGANHVVAVEPSVTERPTNMIAYIRYRPEFTVLGRNRELVIHDRDALEWRLGQFVGVSDVDPVSIVRHDGLPPCLFRQTGKSDVATAIVLRQTDHQHRGRARSSRFCTRLTAKYATVQNGECRKTGVAKTQPR